ncbi:deoxyribodipyrimidine photo-lyase [Xanthomonas sp. CFBP 8445]|uniref:cryptochrome/photolyase family protein n=1 Tax=Xanthomonas sp. CFBP 8445 TaxID=2971236 RepID=UPI0021E08856|nr:deoxyribodipyrimidine photo-lyase [Xanthomonas sp. CFBP 8445]UYC13781.1 DNA photolyase family protein [Xanthomonas sp. CFBP 8445]
MSYAIVWFRRDLRLHDQPALQAALDAGHTPVPVYLHSPEDEGAWAAGAASRSWLQRSLAALDAQLRERGSRLILRQGPAETALRQVIADCGAVAVYWNRRYEPATQPRDARLKRALREQGLEVHSHNSALLFEPWQLATQQGGPYKVFTPFWRSALSHWQVPALQPAPKTLPPPPAGLQSLPLERLGLAPALDWDRGFWEVWQPGEAGAHEALDVFVDGALRDYLDGRDRPDQVGTSRLSPHLHFGEIAPWHIVATLERHRRAATAAAIDGYIRQLGWRDFAHHLLHHFPDTPEHNLNPRFERFRWAKPDAAQLHAWQRGRTGVPIVDAGLRELWHTGWMHNRVRMIVASYLCKHLRVHWCEGARWFWDTLVDADLANNTLGWQWVAGTGADAAPYFRVFNPVTQAQKFDPKSDYIARWVPELAALPVADRFAPWQAPQRLARAAPQYPRQPIVDLAAGRDAALAAYRETAAG